MTRLHGDTYVERYLKQKRAHTRVREALRQGQLSRGVCERQSENCQGPIEGHHEDYDCPLDVTWLCKHHHVLRHVELRRAA